MDSLSSENSGYFRSPGKYPGPESFAVIEKPLSVKVVTLGDMHVGKTSLATRFAQEKFKDKYFPTVGASFYTKSETIEKKTIIFHVWDTAGQERFRSLVPMYLRGSHAALLVFDVTDPDTFDNVTHWQKELLISAPDNVKVALVANKSDLIDQRRISADFGQKFAIKNNMMYIETSAKTGENVQALFHKLGASILRDQNKADRLSTPSSVLAVSSEEISIPRRRCCHSS